MSTIRSLYNIVLRVLLVLFVGVGISMSFIDINKVDHIEFCESSESSSEAESKNGNELKVEDELDAHLTENLFAHGVEINLLSNHGVDLKSVYLSIFSPPPELV